MTSGKPRFLQGGACLSHLETHQPKLKPLVTSIRDIPPHHPPLSLSLALDPEKGMLPKHLPVLLAENSQLAIGKAHPTPSQPLSSQAHFTHKKTGSLQ